MVEISRNVLAALIILVMLVSVVSTAIVLSMDSQTLSQVFTKPSSTSGEVKLSILDSSRPDSETGEVNLEILPDEG